MCMSKAENYYKPKSLLNLHSLTTLVMGLPINVSANVGQGGGAVSGVACHQAST